MAKQGWEKNRELQIGGSGEGNLPSKVLLALSATETKSYIMTCKSGQGYFASSNIEKTWNEALLQFSVPYCPWIQKGDRKVCRTCGCTCKVSDKLEGDGEANAQQSDTPESNPNLSDIDRKAQKPLSKFRIKKSASKGNKKRQDQVLTVLRAAPPYFYVPRLREFEDIESIVSCWRHGILKEKKLTPLRQLLTSKSRANVWKGYTNEWWNKSGSKCAFSRLRRQMENIAKLSDGRCDLENPGSDIEWDIAITKYKKSNEMNEK